MPACAGMTLERAVRSILSLLGITCSANVVYIECVGTHAEYDDSNVGGGLRGLRTSHPIESEAEYVAALARAEKLMDARAGTPEAEELEHLAMVIEAYEEKHHPIGPPAVSLDGS